MKEIYSNTQRAILWLGDYSDTAVPSHPNAVLSRGEVKAAFGIAEDLAADRHHDTPEDREIAEGYRALDALLKVPWWQRIWTVQEALLPKHAVLRYGDTEMPFARFWKAFDHYFAQSYRECCGEYWLDFTDTSSNVISCLQTAIDYRRLLSHDQGLVFSVLISTFRGRLATDPRDKIFGLSGLAGTLVADYSLQPKDVFMRAIRTTITDSGSLAPLLRTPEPDRAKDLPTWAPDCCAKLGPEAQHSWDMVWFGLFAAFDAAMGTKAAMLNPSAGPVLPLQGLLVDEIYEVVVHGICRDRDEFCAMARRWQHTTETVAKRNHGVYPRGGTYKDAFWRTMVGDMILHEFDAQGTGQSRRAKASDEANCRMLWNPNGDHSMGVPFSRDRQFFTTRAGLIGIGNPGPKVGDAIYVLLGGRVPFILRPTPKKQDGATLLEYVSPAYVHGIMDGEVMKEKREPSWVHLI
ncbi:hypothetical protein B0T16DRAFT_406252 [Cercophora newfieldiana]|uniref:Heterokaryon incompatibility domain-containing protein n=1 Tax=Cercophora newfieldiana TaxID=92897 RepID=A0AA39YHM1_9PEZI|nr:hypothetical protein B0T16DRAFT_406252 [Cercophora newfieldiana]